MKEEQIRTLPELLEMSSYVRGDVTYKTPAHYFNLFIDKLRGDIEFEKPTEPMGLVNEDGDIVIGEQSNRLETDDLAMITDVETGPVITIDKDTEKYKTVPRYKAEVHLFEDVIDGQPFSYVAGMLVALDLQMPVIKVYSGYNAHACSNLMIFNADSVYEESLTSSSLMCFDKLSQIVDKERDKARYHTTIINLVREAINKEELKRMLGNMLLESYKSKLPTSVISGASRLLADPDSPYFFEKNPSKFNVMNAMTQMVTDSKQIMNKPEKTLAIMDYFVDVDLPLAEN